MTGIIDYAHTETRSFADLPFNARDTDATETPAWRATWAKVGREVGWPE